MEINWKAKLTSRKLWVSIASFAALLIVAFGGNQAEATQITAIIMAGATVIGYVIGEGLVDAASAGSTLTVPDYTGQPIDTVPDAAVADAGSTGAAQAAEVKQDTTGTAQ